MEYVLLKCLENYIKIWNESSNLYFNIQNDGLINSFQPIEDLFTKENSTTIKIKSIHDFPLSRYYLLFKIRLMDLSGIRFAVICNGDCKIRIHENDIKLFVDRFLELFENDMEEIKIKYSRNNKTIDIRL